MKKKLRGGVFGTAAPHEILSNLQTGNRLGVCQHFARSPHMTMQRKVLGREAGHEGRERQVLPCTRIRHLAGKYDKERGR